MGMCELQKLYKPVFEKSYPLLDKPIPFPFCFAFAFIFWSKRFIVNKIFFFVIVFFFLIFGFCQRHLFLVPLFFKKGD